MQKFIVVSLLLLPLLFHQMVRATGVPTIDVAAIIQSLKAAVVRAQEFSEQISEAKNRLNQLKDTSAHYKDMVEGHFDFESILNDATLNEHLALDDWKDIYEDSLDISDLRDEFGMISDRPSVQERYDKKLQAYSAQKRFYEMSVQRNNNLKNLLEQFDTATNPAAKADLANSIQFENAQIKNDAKMMESMTVLMEQTAVLEHQKNIAEKTELINGDGLIVDYTSAYENL